MSPELVEGSLGGGNGLSHCSEELQLPSVLLPACLAQVNALCIRFPMLPENLTFVTVPLCPFLLCTPGQVGQD